jgi:hypothetical protein
MSNLIASMILRFSHNRDSLNLSFFAFVTQTFVMSRMWTRYYFIALCLALRAVAYDWTPCSLGAFDIFKNVRNHATANHSIILSSTAPKGRMSSAFALMCLPQYRMRRMSRTVGTSTVTSTMLRITTLWRVHI